MAHRRLLGKAGHLFFVKTEPCGVGFEGVCASDKSSVFARVVAGDNRLVVGEFTIINVSIETIGPAKTCITPNTIKEKRGRT